MAGHHLNIWIIIVSFAVPACLSDPCVEYSVVPNNGLRYEHFVIDSQDSEIQDTYITEGWYKSDDPMLDHDPAGIFRCGTKFPIWMDDVPPTSTTPEDKKVCQRDIFNACTRSHIIQAVMCEDGSYRYYLTRTISSSAYCFGEGVPGTRSQYIPPKPEVQVYLDQNQEIWDEYGVSVTSTRFTCEFTESVDEQLWYVVHWHQNDKAHYNTPFREHTSDTELFVTEDVFVNENFKMGTNLSCSVTAFTEANGPPGRRSPNSENKFVGIKVLTPNLAFTVEETAEIRLNITVPIGCQGGSCKMRLITSLPQPEVAGECQPISFDGQCGAEINSALWDETISITVSANEGQLIDQVSYEVYLKIDDTSENKIWPSYTLDPVYVTTTMTATAATVTNSVCSIVNDPHYFGWDRRVWDDHDDAIGTKIAYWHPEFDTEVQINTRSCSGSWIHCICGVAVRAGLDVYVWDVCGGTEFQGYRYCAESGRALTVRARNAFDITIYLPYGTYVRVTRYGSFFNVMIYPTTRDKQKVRGLCGTFDGNRENDFHYRDGTVMSAEYHDSNPSGYWTQPVTFLQEWTANDAENLFLDTFDVNKLSLYGRQICVCEELIPGTEGTGIIQDGIPCTQNGAATCKQTQGTELLANNCAFIPTSKRRRKSVRKQHQLRPSVPRVTVENRITAKSRTKRGSNPVVWTEELARQYCTDEFSSSDLVTQCSQIDSLNTGVFFNICSADIQMTNDPDWLTNSINALGTECQEKIYRNVTLVREKAKGDNPLYSSIDQSQCTDISCSGRGTCENGECVCEAGFAGADCSVDLTAPPSMAGLVHGGVCDASTSGCTETFVYGGHFVDSNVLKCKVKAFEEDDSGNRRYTSDVTALPMFQTYLELKLQLPVGSQSRRRRRRSTVTDDTFVTGFSISVTNDGQTYSDSSDLFVYDSTCQMMQEVNGTIRFTLNDGFCFINNQCVLDGEINPVDNCTFCNQAATTRLWTLDTSKSGCESPGDSSEASIEDGTSTDIAIIAGAAVGALVAIVCIVVIVCVVIKKVFRPKAAVGNSTLFDSPAMIRSDTGLENANMVFKSENLKINCLD